METINTESLKAVRSDLIRRQSAITQDLEAIRADIIAIDRMLKRYGTQETLDIVDTTAPIREGEFADVNLREAVAIVLRRHLPHSVRVSRIRDEIKIGGYKSNSSDLRPAIFGMIGKLIAGGQVRKINKGVFKYIEREQL